MQKISRELMGKKIRDERLKRGLTQDELGELLFMDSSGVCRMEKGKVIGLNKLELVANALNVDVRVLFNAGVIDCME